MIHFRGYSSRWNCISSNNQWHGTLAPKALGTDLCSPSKLAGLKQIMELWPLAYKGASLFWVGAFHQSLSNNRVQSLTYEISKKLKMSVFGRCFFFPSSLQYNSWLLSMSMSYSTALLCSHVSLPMSISLSKVTSALQKLQC